MSISMAFDAQELKRQSEEYRPTFRQSQLIFFGRLTVLVAELSNWLSLAFSLEGATSQSRGGRLLSKCLHMKQVCDMPCGS